jgi:hypothetical protein
MTPSQALDYAADTAAAAGVQGEKLARIDATVLVLAIVALLEGDRPRSPACSSCGFAEHASAPALVIDGVIVTSF